MTPADFPLNPLGRIHNAAPSPRNVWSDQFQSPGSKRQMAVFSNSDLSTTFCNDNRITDNTRIFTIFESLA